MVMQSFIKNCRLNQLAFWSRLVFKIQYVTGGFHLLFSVVESTTETPYDGAKAPY